MRQNSIEQDTERMLELLRELDRMLDEKEKWLEREQFKRGAAI